VDFETFQRLAHEAFDAIPEEFREGVDGLTVRPETLPHPSVANVYTLGHCITESYPSDWTGPDTLRSVVVLYHGSFLALAEEDDEFDWEEELWDTLTHELRHHLESLANQDDLEDFDYAMEEAFKRAEGEPFDPLYYRAGTRVAPGLFQVEYDFFLEQFWTQDAFDGTSGVAFSWHGTSREIPRPEVLGDIHYVWIEGLEVGPGTLQLVLLRKKGWIQGLKDLGKGARGLDLLESVARVQE
jgi:predicted Zn-dependent protease with MMP-like domain